MKFSLKSFGESLSRIGNTKTFWGSVVTILGAGVSVATGAITVEAGLILGVPALLTIFVRDGIAKQATPPTSIKAALDLLAKASREPQDGTTRQTMQTVLIDLALKELIPLLLDELLETDDIDALARDLGTTVEGYMSEKFPHGWPVTRDELNERLTAFLVAWRETTEGPDPA